MIGRVAVLAVVLGSIAGAQVPGPTPPPTPAAVCTREGQAEQTRLLTADRAAGRTPDATTIVAAAKKVTRDCAAKIDPSSGTAKERGDLASLYLYINDTVKARSVIDGMLKSARTESERAEGLLGAVRIAVAAWDPFAGINREAERYLKDLDALSDSVIATKITGHSTLLGRYEYADNDDGLHAQAKILLALSKRALELNALPIMPARPAQGDRAAVPAVSSAYISMMSAYASLARAAGDYLHADSALMILDEGDRVVGAAYPPAKENFARDRRMYLLVGQRATPIDGKWWINAADGSVVKPGDGKISIVQFTAHWCVPCKKSYEPMNRLMAKYKGKPVESIMATELYGYIGARRGLKPEEEVAADREYYSVEHKLKSTVAINPGSPTGWGPESNEARYAVGGIPEIVIIDRKGVIRATVVGWDRGNEKRFATLIDKLLAEK